MENRLNITHVHCLLFRQRVLVVACNLWIWYIKWSKPKSEANIWHSWDLTFGNTVDIEKDKNKHNAITLTTLSVCPRPFSFPKQYRNDFFKSFSWEDIYELSRFYCLNILIVLVGKKRSNAMSEKKWLYNTVKA